MTRQREVKEKVPGPISQRVAGSWFIWFGLSRVCGSTNERAKTGPRSRETSLKQTCFFGHPGIA